jgi:HEAT repeat protein
VIEKIEEVLKELSTDSSPPVREAASAALDRLRAKRSLPTYRQKLQAGSIEERVRIVFSAEEIGGSEGVSLLLAALDDPEAEVRAAAARSLGNFPSVPVLKALVERLAREKGVVLGNILETLGKSRRKELSGVLEKYLGNADVEVNGKAIEAYARVLDKGGWEKILPLARAESPTVRAAVARALSEWSAGG